MEIDEFKELALLLGVSDKSVNNFIKKVKILENGCWEWTASKKSPPALPYGFFGWQGKNQLAHRVSWVWSGKALDTKLEIDHAVCNYASCVNPDHLEQVTRHTNLMRSTGITAKNARKTHCPKGHPYSGVNSQGRRICNICGREALRKSRAPAKFGSLKYLIDEGKV